MISCDVPNHKINYIYSCHLLAQVQVKVGKLDGERIKPTYKEILENPALNYSGVFQHYDLYVTMEIFANNQQLCMPIRTSYKYIEKQPWLWDEWLTLPLRIRDLPRNSQLAITVWDIESPQRGDIPVCGSTITLFDRYGELRQGNFEIRMWPNRTADGNTKTSTPGLISEFKENEYEESGSNAKNQLNIIDSSIMSNNNNNNSHSANLINNNASEEFPILDELDRLAKMSKYHSNGQMIKQDWLDRLTLKEIQKNVKSEKETSKFFYMSIEFAQIKCEDLKYIVLYYEEDAERILQTIPTNEIFVVNDPELEIDNIIELKHRKLEHSKQMGMLDMNLKPDPINKNLLNKIVNYPVNRTLKQPEVNLLWKYRYYLTQNKKALPKVLQCFDLSLDFERNIYSELILKWQPMDIEDALELLGHKYKDHPKIRSYAISRLFLASNDDLILYLLQLVQALRYESFAKRIVTNATTNIKETLLKNEQNKTTKQDSTNNNSVKSTSKDEDLATQILESNVKNNSSSDNSSKNLFDLNLRTFLLQRAAKNESVALCLYWFVKVETKDTNILKIVPTENRSNTLKTDQSHESNSNYTKSYANINESNNEINSINNEITNQDSKSSSVNTSNKNKTNFEIFMDELIDTLRKGDDYAKSIYENILNQEKFLKSLNDVVKAIQREGGVRDKKVIKLRNLLNETSKSTSSKNNWTNLVEFDYKLPLILDPNVNINGINVESSTMFKSNLMPCKFVFKTDKNDEYSAIYKIGDDLRQDQLVVQMIALMDKLLKQENLDLKLSPYKVVATGIKEGFLQFVDAIPMSNILSGEYRSIKEYLKKYNPSETGKYGIDPEAMDSYVRSLAGYMVITYILGVGDRHYDNILITKGGKVLHIDFGYILGRDPKPFQPIIKWTKDMADGMGGNGKENKEYEDFKKYCCNAFLHLRRHANLILNLFSLMVDANIPDIALEPDKTVKKITDRFKLDISDEEAQISLLREIESNYDTLVGNITDIIHTISTAQK